MRKNIFHLEKKQRGSSVKKPSRQFRTRTVALFSAAVIVLSSNYAVLPTVAEEIPTTESTEQSAELQSTSSEVQAEVAPVQETNSSEDAGSTGAAEVTENDGAGKETFGADSAVTENANAGTAEDASENTSETAKDNASESDDNKETTDAASEENSGSDKKGNVSETTEDAKDGASDKASEDKKESTEAATESMTEASTEAATEAATEGITEEKEEKKEKHYLTSLGGSQDQIQVEMHFSTDAEVPEGSHLKIESFTGSDSWKDSNYLDAALMKGWSVSSDDYDRSSYQVYYSHFLKVTVLDKDDNAVDLKSESEYTVTFKGEHADLSVPKNESSYKESEKKTISVLYDDSDDGKTSAGDCTQSLSAEFGNSGDDVVLKYKSSGNNAIGVVVSTHKEAISYMTTPLTYQADGLTVELRPTEAAKIPEGSHLKVETFGGETSWKDSSYLDAALMHGWNVSSDDFNKADYQVYYSHFLKVTVLDKNDKPVELQSDVDYTVTFKGEQVDLSAPEQKDGSDYTESEKKTTFVTYNSEGAVQALTANLQNSGDDVVLKYKSDGRNAVGIVVSTHKEAITYTTEPITFKENGVSVEIEPTEEAKTPEGSKLSVTESRKEDDGYAEDEKSVTTAITADVKDQLKDVENYELKGDPDVTLQDLRLFDIEIIGPSGEKVTPAAELKVSVTTNSAYPEKSTVADGFDALRIQDGKAEILDASVKENKVSFKTKDLGKIVLTAMHADAAATLIADSGDNNISVTAGSDAKLPAGAKLTVKEITSSDSSYKNLMKRAQEKIYKSADEEHQIPYIRFFDISISSGDKENFEPSAKVQVKMDLADNAAETEDVQFGVIHFTDDPELLDVKAEKSGTNATGTVKRAAARKAQTSRSTYTFDTDSFSDMSVYYTYTVDFYFKDVRYSLTGGSIMLLSKLLAKLKIDEKTADIKDISFSDPSLVEVSKDGDDYKLISKAPFHTSEKLTIKMKDGTEYVISVMDEDGSSVIEKKTDPVGNFSAQVFYGGKWKTASDGTRQYVWEAKDSAVGHHFNYRVSFTLGDGATDEKYLPGTIKITVPARLIKDRNNEYADTYEMSIPSKQEVQETLDNGDKLDNDVYFQYEEKTDTNGNPYIEITNVKTLESGFDGFIEMSYVTSKETFEYKDMTKLDEFKATIQAVYPSTVKDENDPTNGAEWADKHEEKVDNVYIDTQAELQSMELRIPEQYDSWQTAWGTAPETVKINGVDTAFDSSKYSYFVYEVRSRIKDNTQKYDIINDDQLTTLKAKTSQNGELTDCAVSAETAFVAAYRFNGNAQAQTSNRKDDESTSDLRYDYVIVAFDKTFMANAVTLQFTNKVTTTVHPADEDDTDITQDSSQTASRSFTWNKPTFNGGGGGFGDWIRADGFYRYQAGRDQWPRVYFTELGMEAGNYSRYDLDDLKNKKVEYLDGLDYAIFSEGYATKWTVDYTEKDNNGNPVKDDDGNPVTLTDSELSKMISDSLTTNPDLYKQYYFQKNIRYVVEDDSFYLTAERNGVDSKDEHHLTSSADYQIDSVRFSVYTAEASLGSNGRFYTASGSQNKYADDEVLTFYAKFGTTDDKYEKIGVYSLNNGTWSDVDADKASCVGDKITFKENCVGYKAVTDNKHYYTRIALVPEVRIKSSDKVLNVINADKSTESIALNNKISTTIYDAKDKDGNVTDDEGLQYQHIVWGPSAPSDADYVRIVEKQSELTKKAVAYSNNTRKKQYQVTWYVHLDENYTAGTTDKKYVEQQSGTFYDLLPLGATMDPDSIRVNTESGQMDDSAYEYSVTENFNGSGRTLVKIEILQPASYYNLYYNTVHSYEAIRDYGNETYNSVAYETGNNEIADGNADNAEEAYNTLSERNVNPKTIFDHYSDYDSTKQTEDTKLKKEMNLLSSILTEEEKGKVGNRFLFCGKDYEIPAITSAASGLTKKVKSMDDSSYQTETTVRSSTADEPSTYQYQIRYANSYFNTAQHIVLFDALENTADNTSDWHGTLKSIDLSALKNDDGTYKVSPKIYYSTSDEQITKDNVPVKYNENSKKFDVNEGWTLLNLDQISDVEKLNIRALAIVLDKTPDGETFTLEQGGSVVVTLNMLAPAGVAESKNGYPQSYNRASVSYLRITDNSFRWTYSEKGDTTARLVVERDVRVLKKSSKDDSPIKGVSFRLTGTSDYGTNYDLTAKTNSQGKLNFKNVEKGSNYTLMEYESVPDYQLNPTIYEVTISDDGSLKIKDTTTGDEGTYKAAGSDSEVYLTVKDDPRIHGDLTFFKSRIKTADSDALVGIKDTTFILSGISDYKNDIVKTATSDEYGNVNVEDIELGTYTLQEIKANDDYILNSEKYQVTVNESGTVTIQHEDGTDVEESAGEPVLYNTPLYWDVSFVKVDAELTSRTLQGAVFSLEGNGVSTTATSDSAGKVQFTHLKAGTYLLKETEAPSGLLENGQKPSDPNDKNANLNYELDSKDYFVTLDENGTYTIKDSDGTELEKQISGSVIGQEYIFKNSRALDGTITIYKKWNDVNTDNRKAPVITLTTDEEASKITGAIVTVIWKQDAPQARPSSLSVTLEKRDGDKYITVSTLSDATNKSGNIWTYYFDSVDITPADDYRAYENLPDEYKSIGNVKGKYTGTSTDESTAVHLASGRAEIVNTLGANATFSYTGGEQVFIAPVSGYYKLEVWGASGGLLNQKIDNNTTRVAYNQQGANLPGLGGYSYGTYYLQANRSVYVYVGGAGQGDQFGGDRPSYNGGGKTYQNSWHSTGGGGMTHISTTQNPVDGSKALADTNYQWNPAGTLIVAGGGGGTDDLIVNDGFGGYGGGEKGGNTNFPGTGAEQDGYKYNTQGVGENYNGDADDCGGGGGGWYGGASSHNHNGGAGGGSGYVDTSVLKDAKTIGGDQQIPKTDGSSETEQGHFGNGFARITYLGTLGENSSTSINTGTNSTDATDTNSTTYITNEADKWEKVDGTTWKYVLHVFNDNATYTVTENAIINGYTSDCPTSLDGSKSKTLTVTNTADNEFGSLTIEKRMAGDTQSSRDFQFQITLRDSTGTKLSGTTDYGGVIFTNGVGTVTLTSGSSKEIDGIPIGYHYQVNEILSEAEKELYTPNWTNVSGDIQNGNVTALCTNTYTPPQKERQDVTLVKKISGSTAGAEDDTYTIRAVLTGLDASGEFNIAETRNGETNNEQFTADALGNANVTLNMKADEMAVFQDLPVGATYQFIEDPGNWTASYQVKDNSPDGNGIIVSSSGENTQKNHTIATGVETVDSGENITVTFTNTLRYQQTLTVKKVVDPENTTNTFKITVNFWNLGDMKSISTRYTYPVQETDGKPASVTEAGPLITVDSDGTANITLDMKHGDCYEFDDIPVSAKYEVQEAANKYKATYTITGGKTEITGPENAATQTKMTTGLDENQEGVQIISRNVNPVVTITNQEDAMEVKFAAQDYGGNNLTGAKFKLKRKNANGVYVDVEEFQVDTMGSDGNTVSESGIISKNLTPGDYLLTETTAPSSTDAKYLLNDSSVKFSVSTVDKAVKLSETMDSVECKSSTVDDKTVYTLVLKHKKLQKLPKTGGRGIGILILASALFAIGAAVVDFTGKKKKRQS